MLPDTVNMSSLDSTPEISPYAIAQFPRLHGPQGCGVGSAFLQKASPKTVEIRLESEELVYLDHHRLPVSALHQGDKFLYVERLSSGNPLVLLMEVTANPCIFDSRGHAVARYKELALPACLLQEFSSCYEIFSVEFGNDFYHRCISRRRDEFVPEQHRNTPAIALRVQVLGAVRRTGVSLSAQHFASTDSTAFSVFTGIQDSNAAEPEDSIDIIEFTPSIKATDGAKVETPAAQPDPPLPCEPPGPALAYGTPLIPPNKAPDPTSKRSRKKRRPQPFPPTVPSSNVDTPKPSTSNSEVVDASAVDPDAVGSDGARLSRQES